MSPGLVKSQIARSKRGTVYPLHGLLTCGDQSGRTSAPAGPRFAHTIFGQRPDRSIIGQVIGIIHVCAVAAIDRAAAD
jgi:hypothetical protein